MRSLRPNFSEAAKNVQLFNPVDREARREPSYRTVEELAGEGDHAVREVGFDEFLADVALALEDEEDPVHSGAEESRAGMERQGGKRRFYRARVSD